MSEISVLSNQYNKLVSTADKANDCIVIFKKANLLNDERNRMKYPKLKVSLQEKNNAREFLLPFLRSVKRIVKEESPDTEFIPNIIIDDYRVKLAKNPYLSEDLDKIIHCLQGDQYINGEEIAVLDSILTVLDKERGDLFKRLRTARG